MGAVRVRWSTLARWVGGGLGVLLALQALPSLLRPPAPEPLAADIGLPRLRCSEPVTPPARVARVSPALALPARKPAKRHHGETGLAANGRSQRGIARPAKTRPSLCRRRRRRARPLHFRCPRSAPTAASTPRRRVGGVHAALAIVPRRFGSPTRIRAGPDAGPGQGRARARRAGAGGARADRGRRHAQAREQLGPAQDGLRDQPAQRGRLPLVPLRGAERAARARSTTT